MNEVEKAYLALDCSHCVIEFEYFYNHNPDIKHRETVKTIETVVRQRYPNVTILSKRKVTDDDAHIKSLPW